MTTIPDKHRNLVAKIIIGLRSIRDQAVRRKVGMVAWWTELSELEGVRIELLHRWLRLPQRTIAGINPSEGDVYRGLRACGFDVHKAADKSKYPHKLPSYRMLTADGRARKRASNKRHIVRNRLQKAARGLGGYEGMV